MLGISAFHGAVRMPSEDQQPVATDIMANLQTPAHAESGTLQMTAIGKAAMHLFGPRSPVQAVAAHGDVARIVHLWLQVKGLLPHVRAGTFENGGLGRREALGTIGGGQLELQSHARMPAMMALAVAPASKLTRRRDLLGPA